MYAKEEIKILMNNEEIYFDVQFEFNLIDGSFNYSYGSINDTEKREEIEYHGYYLDEKDILESYNEDELKFIKNYLEKDRNHEDLFYKFCQDYDSNVSKEMRLQLN